MKPVTFRSETRERRLQTVRGHRSPAQRRSRPCRYGRSPEVTPGPAATFDHRPHAQSTTVASLTAAPKDVSRSISCPKHFLTYRGVKMARSSRNRRTARRSRRISSRSSVRRPSLRSPPSRAACAIQVRMAWDDGSNSRASSPGVRPDRTNSTICCRNAAGYGGLVFDSADTSSSQQDQVSAQPGQLHPEVGQRRAATRTLPAATPIVEIERFTNAIGDLPEAANALRDRPVQYVAQSGEVIPQAAAPDLILNLHAGHSSEVAS